MIDDGRHRRNHVYLHHVKDITSESFQTSFNKYNISVAISIHFQHLGRNCLGMTIVLRSDMIRFIDHPYSVTLVQEKRAKEITPLYRQKMGLLVLLK